MIISNNSRDRVLLFHFIGVGLAISRGLGAAGSFQLTITSFSRFYKRTDYNDTNLRNDHGKKCKHSDRKFCVNII